MTPPNHEEIPAKTIDKNLITKFLEFIEPDPVTYTRLAAVNSVFYAVFTDDKLWEPLDVYGVKTNIFKDFIQRGNLNFVRICWQGRQDTSQCPDLNRRMNITGNLYAQLGLLVVSRAINFDEISNPSPVFVEKAVLLTPYLIRSFGNDRELALKVITKAPYAIGYISEDLKEDLDFWKELLASHKWELHSHPWSFEPPCNEEITQYVLELEPRLILNASDEMFFKTLNPDQQLEYIIERADQYHHVPTNFMTLDIAIKLIEGGKRPGDLDIDIRTDPAVIEAATEYDPTYLLELGVEDIPPTVYKRIESFNHYDFALMTSNDSKLLRNIGFVKHVIPLMTPGDFELCRNYEVQPLTFFQDSGEDYDEEIYRDLILSHPNAYNLMPEELQENKDLFMLAYEQKEFDIIFKPEWFKPTQEFFYRCPYHVGDEFEYTLENVLWLVERGDRIPTIWKDNEEVAIALIEKDVKNYEKLGPNVRKSSRVRDLLFSKLTFVDELPTMQLLNETIASSTLDEETAKLFETLIDPRKASGWGKKYNRNLHFVKTAVKCNWQAFMFVDEKLAKKEEVQQVVDFRNRVKIEEIKQVLESWREAEI